MHLIIHHDKNLGFMINIIVLLLVLKEIKPEYSLEELMLKLKLQYFSHLLGRVDSLEKALMLGKNKGRRKRGDRG